MQGFFQTPDPNPNHTVAWATLPATRLRVNRRITFEITVSKKMQRHQKYVFFFFCAKLYDVLITLLSGRSQTGWKANLVW